MFNKTKVRNFNLTIIVKVLRYNNYTIFGDKNGIYNRLLMKHYKAISENSTKKLMRKATIKAGM